MVELAPEPEVVFGCFWHQAPDGVDTVFWTPREVFVVVEKQEGGKGRQWRGILHLHLPSEDPGGPGVSWIGECFISFPS